MSGVSRWYTYIIECEDGSLYTGCTNHLIRRWKQHCRGSGAKYFRGHQPKQVVFVEKHPTRSEACKREYQIKQLSRPQKKALLLDELVIRQNSSC